MTYVLKDKDGTNARTPSAKTIEIDGKPVLFIGTRDGTAADDKLADMDLFGLGNREQMMLAISRMSEAEYAAFRADADEKIRAFVQYHRDTIDSQAAILKAQYDAETNE